MLPGGQPGTTHLGESPVVARMVTAAASQGKKVAAICAAPTVLAKLGLLNGREAVCYPSCRENLAGAVQSAQPVVVSGRFITGEALGSAIPFALELAAQLTGPRKRRGRGKGNLLQLVSGPFYPNFCTDAESKPHSLRFLRLNGPFLPELQLPKLPGLCYTFGYSSGVPTLPLCR